MSDEDSGVSGEVVARMLLEQVQDLSWQLAVAKAALAQARAPK